MHIDDVLCVLLRLVASPALCEAHLSCVDEVPAFVLVVVVRVQTLLAEVAEVVSGHVRLRPVVGHNVALERTLPASCLAYQRTTVNSIGEATLLTIELCDVLPWGHELREGLVLVAGHGAVTAPFQSEVLLEVGVEVLFESKVSHESHAADAAVKFDAVEDLSLGSFVESEQRAESSQIEG